MDFRDAWNTVTAELTPQPWEYTDDAGVTLTVIPAGLREAPGCAEVLIKVTASRDLAVETGITTADLPALIAALDAGAPWSNVWWNSGLDLRINGGGLSVTVYDTAYTNGDAVHQDAEVRLPVAQRLPLASALRRATDVARGWEDEA